MRATIEAQLRNKALRHGLLLSKVPAPLFDGGDRYSVFATFFSVPYPLLISVSLHEVEEFFSGAD